MSARKAARRPKTTDPKWFFLDQPRIPIAGAGSPAPCPFCGSADDIFLALEYKETHSGEKYPLSYGFCDVCGAQGSPCTDGVPTEGTPPRTAHALLVEAAAVWNKREVPSEQKREAQS